MGQEATVFSQILGFLPYNDFHVCVRRYDGNKGIRRFSCWEQFLAMAFAQLTHRESLRDIEVSLAAHQKNLYRAGFRYSDYGGAAAVGWLMVVGSILLAAFYIHVMYRRMFKFD